MLLNKSNNLLDIYYVQVDEIHLVKLVVHLTCGGLQRDMKWTCEGGWHLPPITHSKPNTILETTLHLWYVRPAAVEVVQALWLHLNIQQLPYNNTTLPYRPLYFSGHSENSRSRQGTAVSESGKSRIQPPVYPSRSSGSGKTEPGVHSPLNST